jgi:hypothetical protein
VNDKLAHCSRVARKADAAWIRQKDTAEAIDEAAEAFMAWREVRHDLCLSLSAAVKKWSGFQQDIEAYLRK